MKCQRCGSDIPTGEIFCFNCGEEVQLVPDYNSVEYMIQQKRAEEELEQQKEQERLKRQARQEKKEAELKKKKKRKLILITVLLLVLSVGIAVGAVQYIKYRQANSYDYQYQMAYDAYKAEDYAAAEEYAERALELRPKSENAIFLSVEVKLHNGDIEGGAELLQQYIEDHPESIDAYSRLISVYEEEERYDDIRILMENCSNDPVLTQFAAYIPSELHLLTEPGEYTEKPMIELEYNSGTVYYTTDGTDPTKDSEVYTEPVLLEEGTTTFKAVVYSEAGIPSEIISGKYVVTLARPNAPFISPASGDYEPGSVITVIVPEGCTAYYAFDSIATSSGQEYSEPVTMPDGEHIFSVIVVDQNGKQSYPASETYVVE